MANASHNVLGGLDTKLEMARKQATRLKAEAVRHGRAAETLPALEGLARDLEAIAGHLRGASDRLASDVRKPWGA